MLCIDYALLHKPIIAYILICIYIYYMFIDHGLTIYLTLAQSNHCIIVNIEMTAQVKVIRAKTKASLKLLFIALTFYFLSG